MSAHIELLDLVLHSTLAVNEDPIVMLLGNVNLRDYLAIGNNCLSLNSIHIVEYVCMW